MTRQEARRLRPGERIVVASHNPGKVREIRDLVAPFGLDTVAAATLGLPEPEETGETFEENARIKALAAAQGAGLPALADDSGLEVEALGGEPGIYSARWAGGDKTFRAAMERVQRALEERGARGETARRANFTCALCLAWPDGETRVFLGKVFGHIVWPPRGEKGFGYDPIFVPEGRRETFAEMEPKEKHAMSHRAQAFALFVAACLETRDAST